MYLDQYKIEGTINNDQNPCFHDETTYPQFQEELEEFKHLLIELVYLNEPKTFYKFGDGDSVSYTHLTLPTKRSV